MPETRPRPIFIVYFDLGIGGVQRKIVDLINRMARMGASGPKIYLLLIDARNNFFIPQIHNPHVKIIYKKYPHIPLWLFIYINAVLYRPKTILTFLPVPSLHASLAIRLLFWTDVRLVISEDVITSHAFSRGDFDSKTNQRLSAAFSRAHVILVPSQPIADDLIKNYRVPGQLIVITPNWTVIRAGKSGTTDKNIDCVYIGRFDNEKRLPLLVGMIDKIRENHPSITLRLFGRGRELGQILNMINKRGLKQHVIIKDAETNVSNILKNAKIAVYASDSEGIPMFFPEAMMMGLPIVAMEFPGIENIIIDQKSGIICRRQSQFITEINSLLNSPRRRSKIGQYAKNIAKKRFSPSNMNTYINYLLPS